MSDLAAELASQIRLSLYHHGYLRHGHSTTDVERLIEDQLRDVCQPGFLEQRRVFELLGDPSISVSMPKEGDDLGQKLLEAFGKRGERWLTTT